jgi:cytochrome c oxidase subunit 1
MLVGIPTGIKIFNWMATIWGGKIRFATPMLFCLGFLIQFLIAGLTGIMLSASPWNWQLHNSYFVIAHFHYVLVGAIVFNIFAAIYYWYPKATGRMLSESSVFTSRLTPCTFSDLWGCRGQFTPINRIGAGPTSIL